MRHLDLRYKIVRVNRPGRRSVPTIPLGLAAFRERFSDSSLGRNQRHMARGFKGLITLASYLQVSDCISRLTRVHVRLLTLDGGRVVPRASLKMFETWSSEALSNLSPNFFFKTGQASCGGGPGRAIFVSTDFVLHLRFEIHSRWAVRSSLAKPNRCNFSSLHDVPCSRALSYCPS